MRMTFVGRAVLVVTFFSSLPPTQAEDQSLTWLAHNDVIYEVPARDGWQGLPLGNGKLGAQVWQPNEMVFQLNTDWGGCLGASVGRVKLRSTPGLLQEVNSYRQRLSLLTATLLTEIETPTGQISIKAWMPAQANVLVVEVQDRRSGDVQHLIEIESWHPNTAKHVVRADGLLLTDAPVADYPTALTVGLAGTVPVQTEVLDGSLSRMKISGKSYTLFAAFADARDPQADTVAPAQALLERCRREGVANLYAEHTAWWADFWSHSYVQLTSPDGIADYQANLWYMHIYAMGAGSRGAMPPKFNGGLWLHNKDEREWGPGYWHWNTQETYWPLYAANHLPLVDPYYAMYFEMLERVKQQTKEYFGVEGAHYAETIGWNGVDQTGKGPPQLGIHARLPVPQKSAFTDLIFSSSAEIAMQFWWRYLYTGDRTFLQEGAYPLMRAVGDFYLEYLTQDSSGHYFIYPSNAHETYFRVKNPVPDLAAIQYLFATLIKASELLEIDAEMRPLWRDRLQHLSPWPMNTKTDSIAPYEVQPGITVERSNAENPELFSVGVFPLITLGSADLDLGIRTFRARPAVNGYGWTTDIICAARLGLREEMEQVLLAHAEAFQNHPSGLMDFAPRNPALHPYLEASGVHATGLGEMLLQSWPENAGSTEPILRICPALPPAWDARFKLLGMGGFLVEGVAEKGQLRTVAITSTLGGTARVVNPFGKQAIVTKSDFEILRTSEAVLSFPTEAGQTYVLTAVDDVPLTIGPAALVPNELPKQLRLRWIGMPVTAAP